MQLASYRNTERGIERKKLAIVAEQPPSPAIVNLQARRDELEAELADFVRQREDQIAGIASHNDHVAKLLMCRQNMEAAMLKAAEALTEFKRIETKMRQTTSIETIATRICRVFKISRVELFSAGRSAQAAFARHAVCYWAMRRTSRSTPQIGQFLGGRDPTTILNGKRVYIEKRAKQGRTLRAVR
jgi:chromosomal replication initiation ATPase DnaA